jgi:LacI family transcriptional regulator
VLEDVFVATSLNHLSNEIEAEGRFMMVKKTRDTEDIIKFASMWNLDGLVLLGFCEQDYLYLRSHMRIPFVVYDGFCDDTEGICNITIHNYDGGLQVGKYFQSCGHSRALCIADNEICMDKERWEGFRDGFGPGAEFLRIPMHKQERMAFYEEHLEQLRQFSAVFAVSDFYAVELIHFLQEREILVPRDISVAGFDDTPMCRMVFPALTSVRQDVALRARISMEQLRALRTGEETVNAVTLPVELVIRDSTK